MKKKRKGFKGKTLEDIKEGEMAKKKKNKRMLLFLQILRWLSLALAILFFLWLAKNLGWLMI
ncbi:MAG: hypothetical protein KJ566_03385 [Nanoarchaeota archaeon]|nr:hypothetical protein [Nanoarchaeota archaeon]